MPFKSCSAILVPPTSSDRICYRYGSPRPTGVSQCGGEDARVTEVFRFSLLGLGAGGLYALAAIGLVLVYRGSGVVNFSQAAMGMVGAYVFYEIRTHHGLPAFLGVAGGLAASALVGALFHLLILRRMTDASNLAKIIASLALLIVLQAGAVLIYSNQPKLVPSMLPTGPMKILGASVGRDR